MSRMKTTNELREMIEVLRERYPIIRDPFKKATVNELIYLLRKDHCYNYFLNSKDIKTNEFSFFYEDSFISSKFLGKTITKIEVFYDEEASEEYTCIYIEVK